MKLLLVITVAAPALASCADGYDKSADSNCGHLAASDRQAQWELVAPGVVSLGMDMQTKKRLGIANSNQVATNATTCLRNEDNREHKPQIQDLQKIGRFRGPGSRLV